MFAIILAAGTGSRLSVSPWHDGGPKCLLDVGGKSLLQRHLENLAALERITEVGIVAGHQASRIRAALPVQDTGLQVDILDNPDFELGSVVSLWTARRYLKGKANVLLMDADVLYDPAILERLTESSHASCVLVDRDFVPGDEPVKVLVKDNAPIELRKQIDAGLTCDYIAESVGFFRFSPALAQELAQRVEHYIVNDMQSAPHEEAVRDVIRSAVPNGMGIEDITGLPWIEIDFPEDVEHARGEVLTKINNN